MKSYIDCWVQVASDLFAQALAGEPELLEGLPKPLGAGSFGFRATLCGDEEGRFSVLLDGQLLETSLAGEGLDQKTAWGELVRETAEAAAGELLARTGKHARVENFEEIAGEAQVSRAFQLRSGDRSWTLLVRDEVRSREVAASDARTPDGKPDAKPDAKFAPATAEPSPPSPGEPPLSRGLELLLDIELEAALRFGSREMPLGEILELGPGDVVQLDRHVSDPVDLIVSDKIVARGDVVLVNGNFGLRVTEVAAPQKRLESIRCLF
jgi:flagellar motor switch protein FliN